MSSSDSSPRRMIFTSTNGKTKFICTYEFRPEDQILESDLDPNAGYKPLRKQMKAIGDCV